MHNFIASFLFTFSTLEIYSQQSAFQSRNFFSSYMLDKNQVNYSLSVDFSFIYLDKEETLECLGYDKTRINMSGFHDKIVSKDKNFVSFIYIPPVCSKDSVYIDSPLFPELKLKINTNHLSHIKADFRSNTGKGINSLEGFPIEYKSSEYAHRAFN